MRALGLVTAGIVACSGGSTNPSRPVIGNPAAAPVVAINPVCPEELHQYSWDRELFPGCPPRPFWWIGTTCGDGACPMPCRDVSLVRGRTGLVASRHEYERGRWKLSERGWSVGKRLGEGVVPQDPPPGGRYCTRSGDRGTCDVMDLVGGVERRVTQAEVRYNEAGDPTSVLLHGDERPNTYEWAAGHQLVRARVPRPGNSFTEYRYRYDERGRLVRVMRTGWGDGEDALFGYDANGLVARIDIEYGNDSRFKFTFEYDEQRRPVHLVWLDEQKGIEPMREEQTYEYTCPAPKPSAQAVPVLEQFKQKACACTDHACSERVMAELERWRSGVADAVTYANDPDRVAGAKLQQLDDEIERCKR